MGDTWSPHTAPAIHADIEMMRSVSTSANTAIQMGINMPNVPHDVPVANAKNAATTKIIAGSNICNPAALLATAPDTYSAAPSESVILFKVQASVNISTAGTIDSNPFTMLLMASSKLSVRRLTSIVMVRISVDIDPNTRPTEALLCANAFTKS